MTAVQVNIQQGTPEWHDLIRRTIGGSEVGILFGLGHITREIGRASCRERVSSPV